MLSIFDKNAFLSYIEKNIGDDEVLTAIANILANKYYCYGANRDESEFFPAFEEQYWKLFTYTEEVILSVVREECFLVWFESFVNGQVSRFLKGLPVSNGSIRVFRAISTEYDYLDKNNSSTELSVGVCWSFLRECAVPYHGFKKAAKTVVFEGSVDIKGIDIYMTVLLNFGGDTAGEKEIRLKSGVEILNFKIFESDKFLKSEPVLKTLPFLEKMVA